MCKLLFGVMVLAALLFTQQSAQALHVGHHFHNNHIVVGGNRIVVGSHFRNDRAVFVNRNFNTYGGVGLGFNSYSGFGSGFSAPCGGSAGFGYGSFAAPGADFGCGSTSYGVGGCGGRFATPYGGHRGEFHFRFAH